MQRPSNRELKVIARLETGDTCLPSDFADIGDKTFARLVEKGWIAPAVPADPAQGYKVTDKGLAIYDGELAKGRWKR